MELGTLRPILTALFLPPLAPLLLALIGLILVFRKKRGGLVLTAFSLMLLWVLSCHGTASWLSRTVLPQFPPLALNQLQTNKVQAIVILGGGVLAQASEYGEAQPRAETAARLRYGLWLARQSGLPVAFSGGVGWAASSSQTASEARVAQRIAEQDFGQTLRWTESESRNTTGNARLLAPLLQRDGVLRIALVTHASHMPRAVLAFERAGFQVTPAATGYEVALESGVLEWLPSAPGLMASQQVLREWLASGVSRFMPI